MDQWLRIIILRIKKRKKGKGLLFFLRLINLRKIGSVFNVSAISLGLSFVEGDGIGWEDKKEREREKKRDKSFV